MKLVIIGGVAGGASAAAQGAAFVGRRPDRAFRARSGRFFRQLRPAVLPGRNDPEREKLLVTTAQRLHERFNLDVRTRSSVEAIDRAAKKVRVRELATGREYEESYDKLILAPGAAPIRPPLPGIDLPGIFTLRNLQDTDRIKARIDEGVRQAVVVGAGFIGLEMVENLVRRGISTTLVELQDQVLPPLDKEMTTPIAETLAAHGVTVLLGDSAACFEPAGDGLVVQLKSGRRLPAQLVILGVGVRPENKLAVDAGLDVGPRGGIRVNEHLLTSDPDIYAVGDAIEVTDFVFGDPTQVPLAGPANRQGRIAADNVFGRSVRYRGTQGTAIVGLFDRVAAMTGASEKALRRASRAYRKVYIHPADHAGYYPGAEAMTLEAALRSGIGPRPRRTGRRRRGCRQADRRAGRGDPGRHDRLRPGGSGTCLRAAIRLGERIRSTWPASWPPECCAAIIRRAISTRCSRCRREASAAAGRSHAQEFAEGHIPGAVNVPVDELRTRLGEVPRDREVAVYCQVGQRGYLATRILQQAGYAVTNLGGGYKTYRLLIDSLR